MAKTTMRHNHRADTLTRITVMGLTVLLLWGEVSRVEGGCSRFGHSCFGAHGKRAEIPAGYNPNLDPMVMIAPVGSSQVAATGLAMPSETIPETYYPNLLPLNANNNRMSPYMLEWILSAHRADNRQPPSTSADDAPMTYRRK